MSYTLGQAAKAAGRTKPTILRAIKSHKISAVKDEASGEWRIEPAELHRVYPSPSVEVTPKPTTENVSSYNELHIEVTLLRERVTANETLMRDRLADKDAMIAELRDDRDQWREQAQRLAITDQRAKTTDVLVTPPPAAPSGVVSYDTKSEPPVSAPAVKPSPVVKVKTPAKEASWLRRMIGGR